MKKITILLLTLIAAFSLHAQVVNVCGTDSIVLQVENYDGKGVIEWQESIDSINWVTIPEFVGETYKFFPTQTKYYRAVVKTSNCDPLYSAFSFVQLPPKANAGSDRIVGGTTTTLLGNNVSGASGLWTILSGTKGILSEPTNPYSEFTGIYNQPYELVWTVTNACGQSSDTLEIRFDEIISKNNFIVVDNTDSLYSDSTDMASGILKIKFSDPTIVPYDSVVLIGIRDSLIFLRKVVSFELNDNIYQLFTEPASLDDLFKSGTISLGDAFNQNYLKSSSQVNGSRIPGISALPTRSIINEYAHNKETLVLYSSDDYSLQRVKSSRQEDDKKITFDFPQKSTYDFLDGILKITLEDVNISLTPNFVLDYSFNPLKFSIDEFKFGLENAIFEVSHKLKIEATSTIFMKDKPIKDIDLIKQFKKLIIIIQLSQAPLTRLR